jgi:hypothetical protein
MGSQEFTYLVCEWCWRRVAMTEQLAPQFFPVAMDAGQERLYFGIRELDMALESSRCMRV